MAIQLNDTVTRFFADRAMLVLCKGVLVQRGGFFTISLEYPVLKHSKGMCSLWIKYHHNRKHRAVFQDIGLLIDFWFKFFQLVKR